MLEKYLKSTGSDNKIAVRGSFWAALGFGGSQLIRLGSNLLLTRLLAPEIFGLMALVQVALQALKMMSDVGISTSVMVSRHGNDPDYVSSAWTIQIIRGVLIWLFSCAVAYPMATIYQAPELLLLIPVMGFSAVFQGFTSPTVLKLKRNIDLKKLLSWQISTQFLTTVITIACAWYYRSIWGIAIGGLIGAALTSAFSYKLPALGKAYFKLDSRAVSEIIHFGKWIFVSSFISFLINKGDIFILGVFLSKTDLGVFSIAAIWSKMVLELLVKVNQEVMTPLYAKIFRENEMSVKAQVKKTRIVLLTLTLPMIWLMIVFAPSLIELLYDRRYFEAGWMLQILAIGSIGAAITTTSGNALLSFSDSFGYMVFQISGGVLLVVCMLVGGSQLGVIGIIAGVAVAKFASYPVMAMLLRRHSIWLPEVDACAVIGSLIVIGSWWYLKV